VVTEKRDRIDAMLRAVMVSPDFMAVCVKAGASREQTMLDQMRAKAPHVPALAASAYALCVETVSLAGLLVDLVDGAAGAKHDDPVEAALRRFEGTRQ
jgi:hypothetical protein